MSPPSTTSSPPIVLAFAASDPTGGAGIQADLMTISALGCHALSVITALTVQNTSGVDRVLAVDAGWVDSQARTVLADMRADAFKIGLLGSVDNMAAIAGILAEHPDIPVVLDPVLASGRGDALAGEAMIAAIRKALLPRTAILTPNSIEARRLAREPGDSDTGPALDVCARRLIGLGCGHVLLTGTHEDTRQVTNKLYGKDGLVHSQTCARLPGSYHGSGCTLASAVAAFLARRLPLVDAVQAAEDYTWQTLAAGFLPGKGQFIPDRFFAARGLANGPDFA